MAALPELGWWHAENYKLYKQPRTEGGRNASQKAVPAADSVISSLPDAKCFCYAAEDGDVLISLSTYPQDSLFVPAHVLVKKSPWFKASLDPKWSVQGTVNLHTRLKRYELDYDLGTDDGGSLLVRKNKETPIDERLWASSAALNGHPMEKCYKSDDVHTDSNIRWNWQHFRYRVDEQLLCVNEAIRIETHELGLSMLLGIPLRLLLSEGSCRLTGYQTVVIIELISWIDLYGDFNELEGMALLAEFINGPEFVTGVMDYPCVYLRISCLLRSESLFKWAIKGALIDMKEKKRLAASAPSEGYSNTLQQLGHDADLLQRVHDWREWNEERKADLWQQVLCLKLDEAPKSTCWFARDFFRSWLIATSLFGERKDKVLVDVGLDRREYPHAREIIYEWQQNKNRNRPLPGHIKENLLSQKLAKLLRKARVLVRDACGGNGPLTRYGLAALDPEARYLEHYRLPWLVKGPTTESDLSAILARVSLEHDDEKSEDDNEWRFGYAVEDLDEDKNYSEPGSEIHGYRF